MRREALIGCCSLHNSDSVGVFASLLEGRRVSAKLTGNSCEFIAQNSPRLELGILSWLLSVVRGISKTPRSVSNSAQSSRYGSSNRIARESPLISIYQE